MKNKILLICVTLVVILGTSLAACSTPAPSPSPSPSPAPAPTLTTPAPKPTSTPTATSTPTPTPAPAAKTIKLKYMHDFPVTQDYHSEIAVGFAKRVADISKGAVTIEIFPNQQLGPVTQASQLIGTRVADMGMATPNQEAGKYPIVNGAVSLPVEFKGYKGYTQSIHEILALPEVQKEYDALNLKPLFVFYTNMYQLWTAKKQINTLADVKGLKIRVPGGLAADIADALGINGVAMASSETPMALLRGTVDGTWVSASSFLGTKLDEMAKFGYIGNFHLSPGFIAINKDVWAGLSPDVQKVLTDASASIEQYQWEYRTKIEDSSIAETKTKGVTLTYPNAADKEAIKAALAKVINKWVDSKGDIGKKILAIREKNG